MEELKTQPIDELVFGSQSQPVQSQSPPQPWGKLIPYVFDPSTYKGILKVEDSNTPTLPTTNMTKDQYKAGRCIGQVDILYDPTNLNHRFLHVISKFQFTIKREYVTNKGDFVAILYDESTNGTYVNNKLVGKDNRVVLAHNDKISLAKPEFKVYEFMLVDIPEVALPTDLSMNYIGLKKLGSGICGEVKLIFSKEKFCPFALKTLSKRAASASIDRKLLANPEKIMNEVNILKTLKHPNIIKMHEVINAPLDVYIMLEVMHGGELFDRVKAYNGLPEHIAKFHFYQIASAVEYLKSMGITHRDLKPENILLLNDDEFTVCKVTDFGMSKLVDSETMMRTFCGTPYYVAPEILETQGKSTYTSQVDVWSLGVILYVMLSGYVPFSTSKHRTVYDAIKSGNFAFPEDKFEDKSRSVKRLIRTMLTVNPEERRTIQQVLLSSWLQDHTMRQKAENISKRFSGKTNENKSPNVDSGIDAMEQDNQNQHAFDVPAIKRPRFHQ